ncbi:helix-turn-helix domain-containing protein [Kitasatospora purpeofusca]|uniref:helix-turn-helix domain-containing protein n=1 Tax=Kitasatospora purpeofusca TaxID=67352 RepID=UPI0030F0F936
MDVKTGVTPEMRQAYAIAVRRLRVTVEELREEAGLDAGAADRALSGLLEMKLVHPHTDGLHFVAVAPGSAQLGLLGPLVRKISSMQERVEQIRIDFGPLAQVYQDEVGAVAARSVHRIEVLDDRDVIRALLTELASTAVEEVLSSRPGGAASGEQLAEGGGFVERLLQRDVAVRALHQHTARLHPRTADYLGHLVSLGAEVRTSVTGFTRAVIFDRSVAVLPMDERLNRAVVVRSGEMISVLVDAFERAWDAAEPLPLRVGGNARIDVVSGVRAAVVRLLVEGETDSRIAARVGVSLRTCQRHIADLMLELGARNRLQAGYRIRDLQADLSEPRLRADRSIGSSTN